MPSKAKSAFDKNKEDVDQLWKIHEEFSGSGPGRKYDVEVLNRSAIVFITACWESFVEDIAKESFDSLLKNAPNALAIPLKVRDFATKVIFEQKDSRRIWDVADSGWQSVLIAHKNATLEKWLGNFNTPKTAQVDALFEELLGVTSISSNWRW